MARLQSLLRARVRGLALALSGSPGAEAIHRCRQLIKQSRAVLRLLRPELDPGAFRQVDDELRALAARLRSARDRTVILETLSGIGAQRAYMLPAIRDIERHWRNHFRGLRPPGLRPEDLAAARRHLRKVSAALAVADLPVPPERGIRGGLTRSYRKARRAWRRAVRTGAAGDWHTCRKHTKYLEYQLACALSFTPRLTSLRQQVHRLGSVLGHAHDLVDLGEALERSQASERPSGAAMLLSLSAREDLLLGQAGKLARAVYASKPGDFERLLQSQGVRFTPAAAGIRARAGSTSRRTGARAVRALPAR